jgi:malate synthase
MFVEEMSRIEDEVGQDRFHGGKFDLAAKLFQEIVEEPQLEEFLTLRAYPYLD